MTFPKIMFIREDDAGDGTTYFVAESDPDTLEEGVVGVYKLDRKVKIRRLLQFKHASNQPWTEDLATFNEE